MSDTVAPDPGVRQLRRLEILTDVIYGLVVFRLFLLFPSPTGDGRSWSSLVEYFDQQKSVAFVVLIGIILTIIHWLRSNEAFGMLCRTDNRHSALSILQLVGVLLFLYAVRLGAEFEGDLLAMILESAAAALMGYLGLAGTLYATRDRNLLAEGVDIQRAKNLSRRFLTEPATATLTIGAAFLGSLPWTISWFAFGWIVSRVVRKVWK